MKEKKKSTVITLTLLFIILVIIGVTYAYFILTRTQESTNIISTLDCLDVSMSESTGAINLTDAVPVSDSNGMKKTPFTFKVTNNCDTYAKVSILVESLDPETGDRLSDDYVKANLSSKGTTDGTTQMLSEKTLTNIESGRSGYKFKEIYIEPSPNGEEEYDLRLWIDSATTLEEGMDKVWNGKIVLVIEAVEQEEALRSKTLYGHVLSDNPTRLTRTNFSTSLETENTQTIYTTTATEDGSEVYYYAGNALNNWVKFGGNYWRIIRTNEDGGVRMLYSGESVDTTHASITYIGWTDGLATYWNEHHMYGWMYGTKGSLENNRTNENSSYIKEYVEDWYTENLNTNYDKYISKTAIYCNDRSFDDNVYDYMNVNEQATPNSMSYAGGTRIGSKKPSYKCGANTTGGLYSNASIADKFSVSTSSGGNGLLTHPIALITADEIMFAGYGKAWYYYNAADTPSEIMGEYGTWWTMTISTHEAMDVGGSIYSDYTNTYRVGYNGSIAGEGDIGHEVRPVISLKSCVTWSKGDGSPTNPYEVTIDSSCETSDN